MLDFFNSKPRGEIVKLKDGTEVTLVYDPKEIKKIKPKQIKEWQNEIVREYTYNNQTKEWTLHETKTRLSERIKAIENNDTVAIYVMHNNKFVGDVGVSKKRGRYNHIGGLGITLSKDFRNKGLGKIIIKKAIELTKKNIKGIKIIELGCYENNPLGIALYKKCGFKEVAKIPNALQWKPPKNKKMQYKTEIIMHLNLKTN